MEIEEPAWRRHEEIDTGAEHPLLGRERDAPVHHSHGDVGEARVVARVRLHLRRQLARGRQDQRAEPLRPVEQTREDGQDEGGGLTGAGLGGADHVLALEDDRDRFSLDGRRFGIAGRADAFHDCGREAECVESHGFLCVDGDAPPDGRALARRTGAVSVKGTRSTEVSQPPFPEGKRVRIRT
jgi:hypothetical protein